MWYIPWPALQCLPPAPSLFLEAWEIPVSGIKKYKKYMERNSTWGDHLVAACLLNCFLLLPITFSSNWFLNTPGWQRLAFHITRLLLCSFSKLFFLFCFFLFPYRSSHCLWDQPWLLHKSWLWSLTRCHHKRPQRLCAVELVTSWSPNTPPASPPCSLSFQTNMKWAALLQYTFPAIMCASPQPKAMEPSGHGLISQKLWVKINPS